jgi:hypothetical protein
LLKVYTNSTGDLISSNIGITNPDGPLREFRTVADLETELKGYHIAKFWSSDEQLPSTPITMVR